MPFLKMACNAKMFEKICKIDWNRDSVFSKQVEMWESGKEASANLQV